MSRSNLITKQSSEKIVLAHIHSKQQRVNFSNVSGDIYSEVVPYFVVDLYEALTQWTKESSSSLSANNSWYYDPKDSTLYIKTSIDPDTLEIIVTFRHFFSNAPCTVSYDLTDTSEHVYYDARIKRSPGYRHKIGFDQKLTSLVGSGDLVLENTDGMLDDVYDALIFENKEASIYSWFRTTPFSEAKIVYRGKITNKTFDESQVSFTIKDTIYDLKQIVPQNVYSESDNVNASVVGKYKRWIYGRVQGLRFQSIDQVSDGFSITGTVSGTPGSQTLTGSGTSFLSELSPDDKIKINTLEFDIESVESDTSLTLSKEPDYPFTSIGATVKPKVPVPFKNRQFLVSEHPCTLLTKTVAKVIQFNRIKLNNVTGLSAGDFVEFPSGERIEIKRLTPGNIMVLRQNVATRPSIGANITRQPVQSVNVESSRLLSADYSITNNSSGVQITIDSDAEFNITRTKVLGLTLDFNNGTRVVDRTDSTDLRDIFQSRDWIKPNTPTYTTFYEILQVLEDQIILRTTFSDPTVTDQTDFRSPNYINDDTIVSGDVLGKTVSGSADETWIKTGPEVVLDLLNELSIPSSFINTSSFSTASTDQPTTISLTVPLTYTGSQTTVKSIVDKINQSITGSVTLDNDLKIKYTVLLPSVETDTIEIADRDVLSWRAKSTSNDSIFKVVGKYRHRDVDLGTLGEGTNLIDFESEFVQKYIGTTQSEELDYYLYDENDVRTAIERLVYQRSLSRTDVDITSDLRLENVQIGDQLILNFTRFYKRFGDSSSRKKIVLVVGKTHSGTDIKFECTDISNLYNRSSVISDDSAPEYSSSSEDEKLKHGFITNDIGIVTGAPDTANIHLIS